MTLVKLSAAFVALAIFGFSHQASAQTSTKIDDFTRRFPFGTCADAWVTKAIKEVKGKNPFGQGDLAECNVRLYGGGKWTTYDDLVKKVRERVAYDSSHPRECRDAFVTKAIKEVTGYAPADNAENGDCNMYNWVEGSWSSYEQLRAEVAQVNGKWLGVGMVVGPDGRRGATNVASPLSVSASNGTLTVGSRSFPPSQWFYAAGPTGTQVIGGAKAISENGAGVIGQNGASVIGQNGASVIGQNGASVIGQNGASLVNAGNGAMAAAGAGVLFSASAPAAVQKNAAALKSGQTMYVQFNASTVIALKAQ